MLLCISCTTYDEHIEVYDVSLMLTSNQDIDTDVEVTLRDSKGTLFTSTTDNTHTAHFRVPAGIYQASASKTLDDDYLRTIINGNLHDMVVEQNLQHTMPVVVSIMEKRNPLLIKEIYCGGCQKDDGSGTFAKDKCIILYNNSSAPVSLDGVAIGMIEPYNAEASSHGFLNNGHLDYENQSWVPAINGIWYFQDGLSAEPYSEIVINVCGAIDNTQTYSNSVNYANSSYYCMYDPSYTSADGKSYDNTTYYPVPSALIPSNHYLLTVKYGQGNAWPMSQTSPALILFQLRDKTVRQYAEDIENIVYPADKIGNIVYACLKIEKNCILDAVEVYNAKKLTDCKKRLTPDLDNGYAAFTNGYGHAVVRRIEKTVSGNAVYQDTNNSTTDFYETEWCSIK